VELPEAAIPGITNAFLSMGDNAQAVFHSAVFSCFELPDSTASLSAAADQFSQSHSDETTRHAAATGHFGHFLADLESTGPDLFVLTPATVSLQPDADLPAGSPGLTADQVSQATLLWDFLEDPEAPADDAWNDPLLNPPGPDPTS
jgi:hypothetical protein